MMRRQWFFRLAVGSVFATMLLVALSQRVRSNCQGFYWFDIRYGPQYTEACDVQGIPGRASYGWLQWSWVDEPTDTCYDYRFPYCNNADDPAAPPPNTCGDERDTIIAEYASHNVLFRPFCSSFASAGGTAHFSWNELNGGFSDGNPHNPWGIITGELTDGLEETRTNYDRGAIRLTSGYRCPHGNLNVSGASQSLHMHGRAADMYSNDHPWTEDEFNLLKAAADLTGPLESFFWNTYTDHHYHASW